MNGLTAFRTSSIDIGFANAPSGTIVLADQAC